MSATVTVWAAFLAGLASILSPCVLPILPVYVASLAGSLDTALAKRWRLLASGASFVLGFSLVFIAMGAMASVLGQFLHRYQTPLRIVTGVLVVLMGLAYAGWLRLPFLQKELRFDLSKLGESARKPWVALVMGAGFALGWTPCISMQLSVVIAMAANSETLWKGIGLLGVYSFGLGLPFLLIVLFFDTLLPKARGLLPYLPRIQKLGGIFMVVVGILLMTGWLYALQKV